MQFKQNEQLAFQTTFKIGGPADWFVIAQNREELKAAVQWAKEKSLPFFILGAGSNLLVSDAGFRGLVIKNQSVGVKIQQHQVTAESGPLTSQLVKATLEQGLAGLEEFFGLPGTVGGAVAVNAHWQRKKIRDLVTRIERFDGLIFSVTFQLEPGEPKALLQQAQAAIEYRQQTQPLGFASAGCIFQNPNPDQSAGYLIDQCGLKGTKIGAAMVSKKHANFILNRGRATAQDVLKLITLIKEKVREKFQIDLELDIIKIGEF